MAIVRCSKRGTYLISRKTWTRPIFGHFWLNQISFHALSTSSIFTASTRLVILLSLAERLLGIPIMWSLQLQLRTPNFLLISSDLNVCISYLQESHPICFCFSYMFCLIQLPCIHDGLTITWYRSNRVSLCVPLPSVLVTVPQMMARIIRQKMAAPSSVTLRSAGSNSRGH